MRTKTVAERRSGGRRFQASKRKALLAGIASGETRVLTDCCVLTEGWTDHKTRAATIAEPQRPPRDPRWPPPGTELVKTSGGVSVSCMVGEMDIEYSDAHYASLGAAARAAARDLGLEHERPNGRVFWGLSRPALVGRNPLDVLAAAWARFLGTVQVLVAADASEELSEELLRQALVLEETALRERTCGDNGA